MHAIILMCYVTHAELSGRWGTGTSLHFFSVPMEQAERDNFMFLNVMYLLIQKSLLDVSIHKPETLKLSTL